MIRKVYIIFAVFFLSRLIVSCCSCNSGTIEFDFKQIQITNLDNSGAYPTKLDGTTMKRATVAFEVVLSSDEYFCAGFIKRSNWGFSSASAFQCDCDPVFRPSQYIENIHILTKYDLSETAKGNTIVNDLFRAKENYWGGLKVDDYQKIDDFVSELPKYEASYDQQIRLHLFCTEEIQNDSTQFEIEVVFNDGMILTTTTDLIYLQ
ncbi:DUF5034 domain-containing protein [uncultured Sunxiuqinia sp.]|uniref:DUF5034 domain-containing protein n=1 Tax=uncultured Sunxiuqinia sp. TaxID=1573825 RepID=UPI002AA606F3|nr:DUF5034 domain-containing protein [uncultured Sunxiuqinia sp.]